MKVSKMLMGTLLEKLYSLISLIMVQAEDLRPGRFGGGKLLYIVFVGTQPDRTLFILNSKIKSMEDQGASVVITHHIKKGRETDYEQWLNEIRPLCTNSTGFVDWQIIRPIQGLTFIYTVIIRFNTITNLKNWMGSPERHRLIEKAKPLFTKDDNYVIKSGLDFLFISGDEKAKVPAHWKQFLITWSAIYPLSVFIPFAVLPALRIINLPQNRYIDSLFISGTVVFLMVYIIMPNYTKLIRKLLYR